MSEYVGDLDHAGAQACLLYTSRLSFSQTKGDQKKLEQFVHRWSDFLTRDTATSDGDLRRFIERVELDAGMEDESK